MKKKRGYKLVLEIFPSSYLCVVFLIFIFVLLGSVVIIYFGPEPIIATNEAPLYLTPAQTSGKEEIVVQSKKPLFTYNREIMLSFLLHIGSTVEGVQKSDLNLTSHILGFNINDGKEKVTLTKEQHLRPLSCSYNNSSCTELVVFRERSIRFHFYEARLLLTNMEYLFKYNLLQNNIILRYETVNEWYTFFETILRGVFTVLSILAISFYIPFLCIRQNIKYCKTEQKWVIVVLCFLFLFNNPVFFLDWLIPTQDLGWLFSLVNIFFTSTFVNVFVLFIMIITHSMLTSPNKRNFCMFYFPKLFVVGINWILISTVLIWERFNQLYDLTFDMWNDLPFFSVIKFSVIIFSALSLLLISYYVFRVLVEEKITHNYQKRFKVFGLFTFFVVLCAGLIFCSSLLLNTQNAAQTLSYYPIFNYYAMVLVVLFLPSGVDEDDSREKIVSASDFGGEKKKKKLKKKKRKKKEELSDFDDDNDDGKIEEKTLLGSGGGESMKKRKKKKRKKRKKKKRKSDDSSKPDDSQVFSLM